MKEREEHGVNPNNWGPYAHLPRPTTDSIVDLLKLSYRDRSVDWKLAMKELIIHTAKLEIRVNELVAKTQREDNE